jgi:hypothetical protein
VSDLIDVSILRWNCSLIDSSFSAYEAKIIKSIPSCPSLPPNKVIWNGTSNGMFSVRSAYHLGLDLMRSKKRGNVPPVLVERSSGKNFRLLRLLILQKYFFGELVKTYFQLSRIY